MTKTSKTFGEWWEEIKGIKWSQIIPDPPNSIKVGCTVVVFLFCLGSVCWALDKRAKLNSCLDEKGELEKNVSSLSRTIQECEGVSESAKYELSLRSEEEEIKYGMKLILQSLPMDVKQKYFDCIKQCNELD